MSLPNSSDLFEGFMFAWLWHCCTPDLRKRDRQLAGLPSQAPNTVRRSVSGIDSSRRISTSFPQPSYREEVRLLSYNIFMRPNIPMSSYSEYQDIRAELFLDHVLPNYDVVCLQEMFNLPLSSRRHEFILDAKDSGFFWHHASSRTHSLSPSIDGGLLILSRFPIVRKDILTFTSAAFADWYASKGVLYCLIQLGPKEPHYIHVFCTHLQATYDDKGRETSERVRKDQLDQTVSFIEKCVQNRELWPILICGDLNVQCRKSGADGSDSQEYLDMLQIFKRGLGVKGELMRDLAKEIDGQTHPITFADAHIDGDGVVTLRETSLNDVEALTKSTEWCNQSLDKIFYIPPIGQAPTIEPTTTSVNPMLIQNDLWKVSDAAHLTHLSDHYAIETKLNVRLNERKSASILISNSS
jgi:endonuclease/exonuclease/phosphatase family metal-dependent hydrolase